MAETIARGAAQTSPQPAVFALLQDWNGVVVLAATPHGNTMFTRYLPEKP